LLEQQEVVQTQAALTTTVNISSGEYLKFKKRFANFTTAHLTVDPTLPTSSTHCVLKFQSRLAMEELNGKLLEHCRNTQSYIILVSPTQEQYEFYAAQFQNVLVYAKANAQDALRVQHSAITPVQVAFANYYLNGQSGAFIYDDWQQLFQFTTDIIAVVSIHADYFISDYEIAQVLDNSTALGVKWFSCINLPAELNSIGTKQCFYNEFYGYVLDCSSQNVVFYGSDDGVLVEKPYLHTRKQCAFWLQKYTSALNVLNAMYARNVSHHGVCKFIVTARTNISPEINQPVVVHTFIPKIELATIDVYLQPQVLRLLSSTASIYVNQSITDEVRLSCLTAVRTKMHATSLFKTKVNFQSIDEVDYTYEIIDWALQREQKKKKIGVGFFTRLIVGINRFVAKKTMVISAPKFSIFGGLLKCFAFIVGAVHTLLNFFKRSDNPDNQKNIKAKPKSRTPTVVPAQIVPMQTVNVFPVDLVDNMIIERIPRFVPFKKSRTLHYHHNGNYKNRAVLRVFVNSLKAKYPEKIFPRLILAGYYPNQNLVDDAVSTGMFEEIVAIDFCDTAPSKIVGTVRYLNSDFRNFELKNSDIVYSDVATGSGDDFSLQILSMKTLHFITKINGLGLPFQHLFQRKVVEYIPPYSRCMFREQTEGYLMDATLFDYPEFKTEHIEIGEIGENRIRDSCDYWPRFFLSRRCPEEFCCLDNYRMSILGFKLPCVHIPVVPEVSVRVVNSKVLEFAETARFGCHGNLDGNFIVIRAVPGAGKTHMIIAKLIASLPEYQFLYLSPTKSLNAQIATYKFKNLIHNLSQHEKEIAGYVDMFQEHKHFILIIDEAYTIGQADVKQLLTQFVFAETAIIMGDPFQIPPIFISGTIDGEPIDPHDNWLDLS